MTWKFKIYAKQILCNWLAKVRIGPELHHFRERLRLLFMEGIIFTRDMRGTFTSQAFKFVRKGKILRWKKQVATIALPDLQDKQAWFKPLEIVRAVVENIFVALDAIFAAESNHFLLSGFHLPSPLGASASSCSDTARQDRKKDVNKVLARLLGSQDTSRGYSEFLHLLTAAEAFFTGGKTTKQAWAAASRNFPTLKLGRKVSLAFPHYYYYKQQTGRFT